MYFFYHICKELNIRTKQRQDIVIIKRCRFYEHTCFNITVLSYVINNGFNKLLLLRIHNIIVQESTELLINRTLINTNDRSDKSSKIVYIGGLPIIIFTAKFIPENAFQFFKVFCSDRFNILYFLNSLVVFVFYEIINNFLFVCANIYKEFRFIITCYYFIFKINIRRTTKKN